MDFAGKKSCKCKAGDDPLPLGAQNSAPYSLADPSKKRDQMTTAEESGLCEASLTYNADPSSRNARICTGDARVVVPRVR